MESPFEVQNSNKGDSRNTFTCPICLEARSSREVFVPSGCTHEFCRECARGVVLSAIRSLDFPIDCPVCKLNSPNADSEDAEEASAGPATDQHDKIRTTDRTHSEHFMLHVNDVDPHHAMQLHASHSTPSLETIMLSDQAQQKMARSSRQTAACHGANPSISSQHADDTKRADKFGGSELKHLGPGIDICAKTAQVGFINGDSMTNDESYQSRSHVHSPSFPVIVTGTPITPSFIPPEPLAPQGSSSLFSAHQPTQRSDSLTHSTEATQSSTLRVTGSDLSGSTDDKKEEEGRHRMAGRHVAYAELAGGHLPSAEQMSQRSASLGDIRIAPKGAARGISSPPEWVTALDERAPRSSSLASLTSGGSRGVPGRGLMGGHMRRGSLDADVHRLLTHEEEEEYQSKSLKAAAHRYGSLVQCPKPDCEGVASLQEGDPHFECPQCAYEWCRECQRDWHPATRCQDVTGEESVSRYIPKKPQKKKKGHRRGGSGCLSMGSMGDLIKGTVKKKFGSMDILDPEVSFSRYMKRNRVLECPQCKNGITKLDGGCNHIMCAICKTHICWLCGEKICQGINNYWDANRHFWIKGTPCYGQIQAEVK